VSRKPEVVQGMAELTVLDKIFHSLPGKIFIVILQTVLSGLLLLFVFLIRGYSDLILLKYSAVLVLGLLAGFAARRILSTYTWTLKLLSALTSTALAMAVLYALSRGFLGINFSFRSNNHPDWPGLIQLALAAFGSILVVTAFRTGSVKKAQTAPAPKSKKGARKTKSRSGRQPFKFSFPSLKKTKQKSSRKTGAKKAPSTRAIQKSSKKDTSLQKVSAPKAPKPRIKKPTGGKKTRKRVKKEIILVGDIEHSCPYCLDPVEKNDSRGVKICPICKTHHHADCWGITGACQIPHSHGKS